MWDHVTETHIVSLDADHDVSEFDCGETSLDNWLKRYALANQAVGSSRTFVLLEPMTHNRVWGYYSLTVASVERDHVTKAGRSNMPTNYAIPAVLLARLARDQKRQSEGYGALLLADAVQRTITLAQHAGVRLLAVNALNDRAEQWYRAHDFQPSPIHDRLLMLTVPDLIESAAHV